MTEVKRRRRKLKPLEEAIQFANLKKDKHGLEGRFISDFKGELNVLIDYCYRVSSLSSNNMTTTQNAIHQDRFPFSTDFHGIYFHTEDFSGNQHLMVN